MVIDNTCLLKANEHIFEMINVKSVLGEFPPYLLKNKMEVAWWVNTVPCVSFIIALPRATLEFLALKPVI